MPADRAPAPDPASSSDPGPATTPDPAADPVAPVEVPGALPLPAHTLLVGHGRVGTRLGAALRAGGVRATGLRRTAPSDPGGTPLVLADLARPLPVALPAVDAVVLTLPPPDGPGGYLPLLRHLAAALPHPPSRTVFVSSTRVFDGLARTGTGPRVDERTAPAPVTDRARTLLAGEEAARELLGAVVLRPAGIYGPGRDRLLRTVREGRPVAHRRRTNRIHETDLVRALLALLVVPEPPATLHAVDGSPLTLGEVVTHLADRLGLPVPPAEDPDPGEGTVLDGSRLGELLGTLAVPDARAGYDALITG